ncbi:hypothetical protein [Peribacillus sp. SCS-155]|uniref:hypothetical protein n=1 Tax=Peribacillus sedimenti TaxID=3115297 RepID=UPI003906330E
MNNNSREVVGKTKAERKQGEEFAAETANSTNNLDFYEDMGDNPNENRIKTDYGNDN